MIDTTCNKWAFTFCNVDLIRLISTSGGIKWLKWQVVIVYASDQVQNSTQWLRNYASNTVISSLFLAIYSNCRWVPVLRKYETLSKCWLDVGSASTPLAQHQASIGSMSRVCWMVCSQTCHNLPPKAHFLSHASPSEQRSNTPSDSIWQESRANSSRAAIIIPNASKAILLATCPVLMRSPCQRGLWVHKHEKRQLPVLPPALAHTAYFVLFSTVPSGENGVIHWVTSDPHCCVKWCARCWLCSRICFACGNCHNHNTIRSA